MQFFVQDDISTCGSYKNNSFDERLDGVVGDLTATENGKHENENQKAPDDSHHVKNRSIDEDKSEQESRKVPPGIRILPIKQFFIYFLVRPAVFPQENLV